MQDQVEAMSKIPDMKTAYAGNYLTLILPIHDVHLSTYRRQIVVKYLSKHCQSGEIIERGV
jgi:hypothetical protein